MGLFSRKPKDGVRGTAQVVSSTAHGGRATHQTCRMNLVVQAEGVPAYSVEHTQMCPAKKWPHPGEVVPVILSRKDPTNLKIDFDSMPDSNDIARQMAEQQAAMLRDIGGHGSSGMPGGVLGIPGATVVGTPQVTIVGGTAADIPPEMRANLEQMLGVDIDGDGRVGGGASGGSVIGAAAGTTGTNGDRLAQLERLAQLRASGALTTQEFDAEKRRLLSS